jgi:hypothetical protein
VLHEVAVPVLGAGGRSRRPRLEAPQEEPTALATRSQSDGLALLCFYF